jgi:lysyl-tRNA synthetase, class II
MSRLATTRQQRIEKLDQLKTLGIDPYPATSQKDHQNHEILTNFKKLEGKSVTVAGRAMSIRKHGPLVFIDLEDQSGRLQLYIHGEELAKTSAKTQALGFDHFNLIDEGDFIQATGKVVATRSGQISVQPTELKMLTKALRPLPDQWQGIKDPDVRYRRRYLDFVINPDKRALFQRKSKFFEANRRFLVDHGFMEVETPVLEYVTGGADARPFTTYHHDMDQDFFLRISTELYQKRLVGAGFEKIFTLGPNFRNEGVSDEHLQEYYQTEWYWAYADYQDNMTLVRDMFRYMAKEVYGKTKFTTRGHTFDVADDWTTVDYVEVIKKTHGIDIFTATEAEMLAVIKKLGIKLGGPVNRMRLIDNLWKAIRKTLSGPAFLINEPKFMSPLAKSRPDRPELTERFHVILGGSELGNGYSELNNPLDQYDRFMEQQQARDAGDDEAQMLDIDYVEMLEYGMPPCSGYAHSERAFWFFEDVTAREGTLFPQMKFKLEETTKEIYGMKGPAKKAAPEKKTPTSEAAAAPKADTSRSGQQAQAHALVEQHIQNSALRRHCLMVALAMTAYAQQQDADPESWYLAGLLHDVDWEEFPAEHPNKAVAEWLGEYSEEVRQAILAHAPQRTDKQPETPIERYLFASDELSGFLYAVSLMRPAGFEGMEVKSVKKKLKDKSFATNVSRDDITQGSELIGVPLEDHIAFLIKVFAEAQQAGVLK